jgi:hypothetical protein
MDIIRAAATDPAVDPAKLRELLQVKQMWEADEARKQFAAAMAGFAGECPIVEPMDPGDRSKYAKLDRIHRAIRPIKAKWGLCLTWTETALSDDKTMIHMKGFLAHRAGHSVPVSYDMPFPEAIVSREGKSVINISQRMGSGTSYCRRYGECAILNVVCGKDDDGAAAGGKVETITEAQAAQLRELCEAAGRQVDALCQLAGVASLADYPVAVYNSVLKMDWARKAAGARGGDAR